MNKVKAVTSVIAGVFACLYVGLSIADNNAESERNRNANKFKSLSNVATITYTEPTYENKAPKAIYLFGEYTVACAPDFFHPSMKSTEVQPRTEAYTDALAETEETVTTVAETAVTETTVPATAVTETVPVVTVPVTAPPVTEPAPAPVVTEVPSAPAETPAVQEQPSEPPTAETPAPEPEPVQIPEVQPENTYSEPVIPISDEEYIILCNAVAHEAGSDWISLYEKAYVAEVIMNRVNNSLFPSTIYDVLTAPYQFTGAENYVNLGYFSNEVTESVKQAVTLYFTEPQSFSQGFLYFYGDGTSNYFY